MDEKEIQEKFKDLLKVKWYDKITIPITVKWYELKSLLTQKSLAVFRTTRAYTKYVKYIRKRSIHEPDTT
jgi:hypothetical protein